MSRLLLKARPTVPQLADRLRAPRPDGLELYLDTADLISNEAMDTSAANLASFQLPPDFDLLIEGPIRSLDGEFFDLTHNSEANRELILRLADLAARLKARAVNVHLIAPTPLAVSLTPGARRKNLEASLDLAEFFAQQISASGAIPTLENMPPVLRMRESRFYFSS